MSGIETTDMRPRTLDQGQLTTGRPSFISFTFGPPSLRFLLEQPSAVLQEYSIMPTESAAVPDDLNRACFVGSKLRKPEDWIRIPPLLALFPSQSHLTQSEAERSGVFPTHNRLPLQVG
jgi:hypothetical protein